jgi:peptide deformylase
MAVREIIRMGHPTLRTRARPLTTEEIGSPGIARLVEDMIETLHHAGGIGLAAPQVNEPVRLAIIEITDSTSRYGDVPAMPLTVFVNPEIEVLDDVRAGFWEGCLSVPGLRGFVQRPQHVRVRARSLANEPLELDLQGFLATVFQHEFDHLDGRLYIDRMEDPTLLMYEEEFEQFVAASASIPAPE